MEYKTLCRRMALKHRKLDYAGLIMNNMWTNSVAAMFISEPPYTAYLLLDEIVWKARAVVCYDRILTGRDIDGQAKNY